MVYSWAMVKGLMDVGPMCSVVRRWKAMMKAVLSDSCEQQGCGVDYSLRKLRAAFYSRKPCDIALTSLAVMKPSTRMVISGFSMSGVLWTTITSPAQAVMEL